MCVCVTGVSVCNCVSAWCVCRAPNCSLEYSPFDFRTAGRGSDGMSLIFSFAAPVVVQTDSSRDLARVDGKRIRPAGALLN